MSELAFYESPQTQAKIYEIFREYFDRAEKNRRWSLVEDIPWDQANPNTDPALADIIQTFCMVELYLPDYVSKLIPQVRAHRGRAWMLANWGYEESKHSMAFCDWLLRSKLRSDEQMTDIINTTLSHEWHLPHDNSRAMLAYTTFQELATQLNYRNLRRILAGKCPALDKVLLLIAVDEAAHADFFRKIIQLHLEEDRDATLEALRQVVNAFQMPAVHMFVDGIQRKAAIREMRVFSEDIYVYEVFEPLMQKMGIQKSELRRRAKREWGAVPAGVPSKA